MISTHYLIIGNGIAGFQAAKSIRKHDDENSIYIVDKENYPTYMRTQLSYALGDGREIDDLYVEKGNAFKDLNVNEILGKSVKVIDVNNNKVILDDDSSISYKKLLIASGAKSFIPPYEKKEEARVFQLRTYDDLLNIRKELDNIDKIVVSGGGLLGLELADALLKQGKEVHVVELSEYILNKQLDRETSERLKKDLEDLGFIIHTGISIKEVYKDKVVLSNGEEIKTDALIFSVGIRSNLDIVPKEIRTNRAIIVDDSLSTNIDNIWACGDCVEIDGRTFGLWTASNEMGKIAGSNMTGEDKEYHVKSLFTNLNLGKIKVYSVGKITNDKVKKEEGNNLKVLFFEEGILVGGILYGDIKEMGKLNKAISEGSKKEELI